MPNEITDNGPDSLVLRYLRSIDGKLDILIDQVGALTLRVNALEHGLAAVNGRIDQVERRLERIERRLNLVESA